MITRLGKQLIILVRNREGPEKLPRSSEQGKSLSSVLNMLNMKKQELTQVEKNH